MMTDALTRALGLERRSTAEELMDTVRLPPRVAGRTLAFLELANRRFGGSAVVLRVLGGWGCLRPARRLTLLDVGTGAADIPRTVVSLARSVGAVLEVTAIDVAPDIVAAARERVRAFPEITVEQCDLWDLASSGRRFDVVTASLFLHHVPEHREVRALQALDRLATRVVVVSDLRRSAAALVGVTLLSAVAGNSVVRHDGPLSVRRAFTVGELSRLAADAGLPYLRARPEGPFRVSLSGEKATHA